jgi:methylmalonyl-CoA/ethylmalonyl-CoA epimerase
LRKPVLTKTTQIGIVVRDLDAAIQNYMDVYGIGPWNVWEVGPGDINDLQVHGQPATYRARAASAMVGDVQWELIEPLDDASPFARFLAEKGEGVHHVAVETPNFDDVMAQQAQRQNVPVLSGEAEGVNVALLSTEQELGVILEVYSAMPESVQGTEATQAD